jgi:hypothetical protein
VRPLRRRGAAPTTGVEPAAVAAFDAVPGAAGAAVPGAAGAAGAAVPGAAGAAGADADAPIADDIWQFA